LNSNNMKLYDKNKFKLWERRKKLWLQNLSLQKAIKLEELLLSSSLNWELRKRFAPDNPVCLRMILNKTA